MFNFSIDNLRFEGSPVSEPSTLVLVGIGLLGTVLGYRRNAEQREARTEKQDDLEAVLTPATRDGLTRRWARAVYFSA